MAHKPMSLRQYAKHRGVTLRAVQKAIESGRIKTDDNGKIDPQSADRDWDQATDPAKQRGAPSSNMAEAYARARAARETANAKLAQLKYEELAGKLVEADKVQAEWQKIITIAKTRLLAVPSKVRARVPHLTLDDIATLEEEIRFALEGLAEGKPDE